MDNIDWRKKFQEVWDTCQGEVKRTTNIGKRMLSASKTNSSLHESYEDLGRLVKSELDKGSLEWTHPKLDELVSKINQCQEDLKSIENEMNKIKFSSGPEDVSKDNYEGPKK